MRTEPQISMEDCQNFPKALFKMPVEAPKYFELLSRKSESIMKKETKLDNYHVAKPKL